MSAKLAKEAIWNLGKNSVECRPKDMFYDLHCVIGTSYVIINIIIYKIIYMVIPAL